MPPFHLAFPVTDLQKTKAFFTEVIGCKIGRTSERWIDFDFFGHQITTHLVPFLPEATINRVDGDDVPSFHFGVVLEWNDWHHLVERLRERDQEFMIRPHVRFSGQVGEQATLFVREPSGNALEFKSFKNPGELFAR